MTNLLSASIEATEYGDILVNYSNLAGLADNHMQDAIAFSAPAFLAHQLSVFPVRAGTELAISAREIAKSPEAKPVALGRYLNKYISGIDLENVPESFDLSVKSILVLITNGQSLRVIVKPKLGILSRFPEERMALLVANYIRHVLSLDLGPYQNMVPTAIEYVVNAYSEIPERLVATLLGNRPDKRVRDIMTKMSISLYHTWQTTINEMS